MVMKTTSKPKSYKIKLNMGVVLPDGKRGKKGETVTVPLNLAKILQSTGRGEPAGTASEKE